MSRDRRDRESAAEPAAGATGRGSPDASAATLLTAYLDGVAELPPEERHRIEGWIAGAPGARAEADAVQSMIGRLRALPPSEGDEPDWAAMERSIRRAVASERPRPWWRSWKWLVPALTCATAAGVLVVILPRSPVVTPATHAPREITPAPSPVAAEPAGRDIVALWLDGSEVDVDLSAAPADGPQADPLGELGFAASAVGPGSEADETDEVGLLPATDLAWVDTLDDDALARAERWLADPDRGGAARKKS